MPCIFRSNTFNDIHDRMIGTDRISYYGVIAMRNIQSTPGKMARYCFRVSIFLCFLLLLMPFQAQAADGAGAARQGNITVVYGIVAVLSLLLLVGHLVLVDNKDVWLVCLYGSVFVVNLGYFALAISATLEGALWANRLAYFGSVFLPAFMLMAILNVCRFRYRKWFAGVFLGIGFVMFLIAASPGCLDWYYQDVALVFVNGMAKLEKVYGPLHALYFAYLFVCFGAMVAVIVTAVVRKKIDSYKHAAILAVIVLGNIAIWLVEQMIYWDFEFLSVSYLISELFLLFLHSMLQDYSRAQTLTVVPLQNEPMPAPVTVAAVEEEAYDDPEACMEQLVSQWAEIGKLSSREKDVLREILKDQKRKDIAATLCISENTVKTHITNLFAKLGVSSRSELLAKIIQKQI